MSEIIEKKMDELAKGVLAIQEKSDRNEGKLAGFDGLDLQVIKETGEKVADAVQELNTLKQKQEATSEALKEVEKIQARQAEGEPSEKKGVTSEYLSQLGSYIRKGTPIDDKVASQASEDFARYTLSKSIEKEAGLQQVKKNFDDLTVKSYASGSNPDGGYWILPEVADFEITQDFESSPIRQVSRVITTTSNRVIAPVRDIRQTGAAWVGELAQFPTATTAQIGQEDISIHKMVTKVPVPMDLLDDASVNVAAIVMEESERDFRLTEATAGIKGDGSQKPKGILAYAESADVDTYERGTIGRFESSVSGDFAADDLIKMQNTVKEVYQNGAVWMMKRATFADVITKKDQDDNYLINPLLLREGADKLLLGKPIFFADDLDAVAASAESMIYGNFRVGYTLVDRVGFQLIRDNLTDDANIVFKMFKRVGGAVTNFESLKVLKIAS